MKSPFYVLRCARQVNLENLIPFADEHISISAPSPPSITLLFPLPILFIFNIQNSEKFGTAAAGGLDQAEKERKRKRAAKKAEEAAKKAEIKEMRSKMSGMAGSSVADGEL